jgi:hypothetical protein
MRALVRLYPRSWRVRYEDEFVMLLAERPPGPADVLDIVRGALDARLHPIVAHDGPPVPWGHRVPGLIAASAGLVLTVAGFALAIRSTPDWGWPGDLLGTSFVLMLISAPGDYLLPFGRRIGAVVGFVLLGTAAAPITRWAQPAIAVALLAEVVALCALLIVAAIRSGIGVRGRWLALAFAFLVPAVALGANALVRAVTGSAVVPDGSRAFALAVVPCGLAWLAIGARTAIRGSATFTDPDIPAFTPEVPA